ncbi:uncharacterized protein LOC144881886 [Branchiostoma floridae x Branchiostoma japonicum]
MNSAAKITFFNHLFAVLWMLLALARTTWGEDSFADPSIIRPPGLDSVGLNVVVGSSVCLGLVVIGVMAAIFYHLVTKSRRSEFRLPLTPEQCSNIAEERKHFFHLFINRVQYRTER